MSSIVVIENYSQLDNFVLPIFANGSPTLVFNTAKATSSNKTINNLTLYGQTAKPKELFIKNDFTRIAYLLYPNALNSFFNIGTKKLTDGSMELVFLKQAKAHNLQE